MRIVTYLQHLVQRLEVIKASRKLNLVSIPFIDRRQQRMQQESESEEGDQEQRERLQRCIDSWTTFGKALGGQLESQRRG